jgi:hypothetical protein
MNLLSRLGLDPQARTRLQMPEAPTVIGQRSEVNPAESYGPKGVYEACGAPLGVVTTTQLTVQLRQIIRYMWPMGRMALVIWA